MSNDLSRNTFNPLDDYFGVVMQQGRVQLDADWNTMVDQFKRQLQTRTLDTFNGSVVPRVTPDGFLISGSPANFDIGPGRIYVDGILAENHTDALKWDARLAEISGTARLSGADIDAAPSGLSGTTSYDAQPYYPFPTELPDGAESYLVYVDVWQRDVSSLQDAELIDVAVGVDTSNRRQTLWQVKVLANVGAIDPATEDVDIPGWLQTVHPSSARLSTATGDLSSDENPCLLPPQAGYKGLENQLYRVQVHNGGALGDATFKWSRDNAVVATRISEIPSTTEIVVDSLGKDEVLSFSEGDWVEITDDYRDFMGMPGELRRIPAGGIDSNTRTITLDAAITLGSNQGEFPVDGANQTDPLRNTRLIRWDQAGVVFAEDESEFHNLDNGNGAIPIPPAGTRLFLENGILVDFDLDAVVNEATFGAEFKAGDYWLLAARVNTGTIEILDRAPPQDSHHHYSKLAIVDQNGITDCRTLWPPELAGDSCACTVCVHPDTHNNGTATIQQAIDQLAVAGGGTVCLSVGRYQLREALRISSNGVTLRGQGWQTALISAAPTELIEIGSEQSLLLDITVERLMAITSVATGVSAAVSATNVFGLKISECLIANLASGRGTSQGVRLAGVLAASSITDCQILAEQGIAGATARQGFLATIDVTIRDCILSCSQLGIDFSGLCFHGNKLDIVNNHIARAANGGIVLTGGSADDTEITVADNLLINCGLGIVSGLSNIRLLTNDIDADETIGGNAISFVGGLLPGAENHIQVIGNRIRNYAGHAIVVQAAIARMMVKQSQFESIGGSGFIIDVGGSVEYLSFENNQLSRVNGLLGADVGAFSALHLQAIVRADIANNLFDSVVADTQSVRLRAAISIEGSGDISVTGNRILGVGPLQYSGNGFGIIVFGQVGNARIESNEVRRFAPSQSGVSPNIAAVSWVPLLITASTFAGRDGTVTTDVVGGNLTGAGRAATRSAIASSLERIYSGTPVVNVSAQYYALSRTALLALGTPAQASTTINKNHFDGRSSSTLLVYTSVPWHCGLSDNTIESDNQNQLVRLAGRQVTANNNHITAVEKSDVMTIESAQFVVMGNMTTGTIFILNEGVVKPLSEPWANMNLII
jgi:hypothetical protein